MKVRCENDEPRVAVVTDLHGDVESVGRMVAYLDKYPVDLVVLNGDIPDFTATNLRKILQMFLKLDVHVVFFGGSHENSVLIEKALAPIKDKNLIDANTISKRIVELGKYKLFMIPGSDTISSGSRKFNGGNMWLVNKRNKKDLVGMNKRIEEIGFSRFAAPVYLSDTEKQLDKHKGNGQYKIVFGHVPARCKTKRGIDAARFGQVSEPFQLQKKHLKLKKFKELCLGAEKTYMYKSITMLERAQLFKQYGYPISIIEKNVGSKEIRKLLNKHHITKYLCGHIHEAGPRCIDKKERKVKQNTAAKELFINNGPGHDGHLSILTLCDKGFVKYKHVSIAEC